MPLPEDEDPELSQLLREQEAFFRDRARPAAKLVVHPKREAEDKLTDDASMREGIGGQGSVQEMKERPQAILGGIVERSGGESISVSPSGRLMSHLLIKSYMLVHRIECGLSAHQDHGGSEARLPES